MPDRAATVPGRAMGTPLPLEGIKVLDLSRALAGPYATALLTDMGADVTKVESIKGGDSTRAWPPFENDQSLYFDSANRGKSSLALDFYSAEGKALLWKLALAADVVVENFRPGVLSTIGLDPAELRAAKPELIIASISGFGSTGPLSQAAGLDQVAQGMSGLMSVTGADSENMFRVGVPIIDMISGIFTAFGIAAALAGRERHGAGIDVSTSLLESALSISSFQGQRFLSLGEVATPQGNNHPVLSPYGVFKTADVPVIIAVGTEKQWRELCVLLGDPGLADDPDYASGKLRTVNRRQLKTRVEQLLEHRGGREWVRLLREAKIPAGPIYNFREVFDDTQVQSLDMVKQLRRFDGTRLPLLRGPLSINGKASEIRKAPPALGEDTMRILADLQLSETQIAGLLDAGIVMAAESMEASVAS